MDRHYGRRYERFMQPVDIPALGARDHPNMMRRPSMWQDLMTVFRKNTRSTTTASIRRPLPDVELRGERYHARRPTLESMKEENEELLSETEYSEKQKLKEKEADVFLAGTGQKGDDDEDEDEGKPMTRQVLLDKIRQKKEVIGKLRCQAWNMNRKRRTLRLAQKYLQQHESRVSRSHLFKQEMSKMWRSFLRWASNVHIYFIPWEQKIKKIESHFGSVVSSYFTFLRWVVFVNICITLLIVAFIVVPEVLADAAADSPRFNRTYTRKVIPPKERKDADKLQVVWHFDGYLRYSPLFYGYYSNDEYVGTSVRYALPLAYFVITLLIFGYSFFAILRKMASNARMSKMAGSKAEQYIFNWKVFTGWDYTIGNSETAGNTIMAMIIKLRESIAESRVDQNQKFRCLQFTLRVFANAVILGMLAFSIYCISFAVQSSKTVEATGNLFTKNQVPTVVATITHVFPMIFDLIGKLENYHPRTALRAHLTRVLVLYVLNYMTLIIALFEKLDNIRDATRQEEMGYIERAKRQMGGRNPNIERTLPYASRSFDTREDFEEFITKASKMFESTTVTPQPRTTTPPGKSRLLGEGFTVHQQFGPVGVNHPKILNRNGTLPPGRRKFEARKLGPPTLRLFTPPPTEPPVEKTIKVHQEYGPEWDQKNRKKPPKFEKMIPMKTSTTTTSTTTRAPTTTSTETSTAAKGGVTYTMMEDDSGEGGSEEDGDERKKGGQDPTEQIMIAAPDVLLEEPSLQENITDLEWKFLNMTKNQNSSLVHMGDSARVTTDDSVNYNDNICWETMIGQEIVKLVTMDLYITIASILLIDFFRGIWVKYCSSWWCWDLETTFPEYGEFKVAENVLHIINNQGMIWLGFFFAPLLPAINNVKLIILMYLRGWAVMTCNVPAREIFRASRSSNFYLMILLLWLLLCTLPVGYVIASKRPSTVCGPFAGYKQFYQVFTDVVKARVDHKVLGWLTYMISPGVIIPVLLVLMLIIYFLVSLVRGLREANTDLQAQLLHERTEEKKKIFELAGGNKKKPYYERFNLHKDKNGNGKEAEKVKTAKNVTTVPPMRQEGSKHPSDQTILCSVTENSERSTSRDSARARIEMPISRSGQTDRVDDWFNEESRSDHSYDVASNVVQLATPDEVRSLIRPLLEQDFVSNTFSLPAFPNGTLGDLTITSQSTAAPVGLHSAVGKRLADSHISVYDNNPLPATVDSHVGRSLRSVTTLALDLLNGMPAARPSRMRLSPSMQSGHTPEAGTTTTTESDSDHPRYYSSSADESRRRDTGDLTRSMPIYTSEPKRIVARVIPEVHGPAKAEKPPLPRQSSKKFEVPETSEAFQPWPSIDEVRKRRENLNSVRNRSQSPVKRADEDPNVNQRRFRISVSPTRKLPGASGSDTDTGGSPKRRYIIKQHVIPGSTASIASSKHSYVPRSGSRRSLRPARRFSSSARTTLPAST
ncbi:hypothetical protein L596_014290 [Steinernema carpocapsae]|uniref:TMC domain-containing protein n=1 Tax=Steinernema carpocapsae TaxID=34508 RepID=A0A4U5NCA3_STECR|nr:hypothetical protein L596_014290 [Steinernema carpocapsae]